MDPFLSAPKSIDVNRLMATIHQRIQERKEAGVLKDSEIEEIQEMELQPLPDFLEIPNVYTPHLYSEAGLEPAWHPQEEIKESGLLKTIMKKIRQGLFPLIRFMTRPIYLELKNAIMEQQQLKPAILLSKEYIKLLHNTLNNVIVEMTKLKIEEETQKTKIRILEDKMEFLENRERAVEKKIDRR